MASINSYSSLAAELMSEGKTGWLKTSSLGIVLRPAFAFIFKYFIRLGFLDGKRGLILNFYHSYYVLAKYAKAWEYREKLTIQKIPKG